MGFDKTFGELAGQPLLAHALRAFHEVEQVSEIVAVTRSGSCERVRELCRAQGLSKVSRIVPGGAERHLSVWEGIKAIGPGIELVAVHDGARPLIRPDDIVRCLEAAAETGAAACAAPVTDTLKRADGDGLVVEGVDRESLWAMQTPQAFRTELLRQAYEEIVQARALVTDEVSAVQKSGVAVRVVPVEDWNFKVTFENDFKLAERVLETRRQGADRTRTQV